jgi:hypothetical protein
MITLNFPPIPQPITASRRSGRSVFSDDWQTGIIDPALWSSWINGVGAVALNLTAANQLQGTGAGGTFAGIVFKNPVSNPLMSIELEVSSIGGGAWLMLCSTPTPTTVSGDIDQDYVRIGISAGTFYAQRNISGVKVTDNSLGYAGANIHMRILFHTLAANSYRVYANGAVIFMDHTLGLLSHSGYLHIFCVGNTEIINSVTMINPYYGGIDSGF